MQIPPTSSAAQAASILSQSTAKDAGSAPATSSAQSSAAHVEKSNSSSADRDAQGQGDGFPGETPNPQEDVVDLSEDGEASPNQAAPQLPGEPPSHLDIIG